jgi:hypothetical protein
MRIVLTKLTDARHRLEVHRKGGASEQVELETRSCLLHDLTHFAVEEAAGISGGFYGSLAAGRTFDDLMGRTGQAMADSDLMMEVERAVAVLQGGVKTKEDPAAAYERIVAMLRIQDAKPPSWFTRGLVVEVHERMRQLLGRWNATPNGSSMELSWGQSARLRP